jgi:hypothetical protein
MSYSSGVSFFVAHFFPIILPPPIAFSSHDLSFPLVVLVVVLISIDHFVVPLGQPASQMT